MKIKLKIVAVVLLVIGGGVGVSVAAISSTTKTRSSSVATMFDSSMSTMKPDTNSCEMCSNVSVSPCTDSSCTLSESMMNMAIDKTMTMGGNTKSVMGGEKMSDVSMVNTMSQSMAEKSMTPSMDSSKMADGEQMAVVPKM